MNLHTQKSLILPKPKIIKNLAFIIESLKNNALIVSPSDTIYGLIGLPNITVINKIINFKNRPIDKPISLFFKNIEQAQKYAQITPKVKNFISSKIPGKYTFILKANSFAKTKLPTPSIISKQGTIGIRIIKCNIINAILEKIESPLTATSANIAGHKGFCDSKDLINNIPTNNLKNADIILDYGQIPGCNKTNPHASTIIDLSRGVEQIKILKR